jgi:predicted DNA-binding protein (MmcQ/YjbR family)
LWFFNDESVTIHGLVEPINFLRILMNFAMLEDLLLEYPGSEKYFPFDETTAVFKVRGKMFALAGIDQDPLAVNLKCDPEDALILRSQFHAIKPGYHMNKDHWNTVILDGSLDEDLLKKLIGDSYALVVKKLSKKVQANLTAKPQHE